MTSRRAAATAWMLGGLIAATAALGAGCDLLRDDAAPDAGLTGDAGFRPPRTDLVDPVGGPDTLDVACWNIEWFPKDDSTVALVADLVASMDLDIVVVEEISSVAAWDELVARLPGYAAVLSPHRYTATSYQKIGMLYREDVVTLSEPEMILATDSYTFPRPPLRVHATVAGGWTLDLVGIHLKAGEAPEDRQRRQSAVRALDAWMRAEIDGGGDDELILLGDYNEDLAPEDGAPEDIVLAPLLDAPDRYRFRTSALAAAHTASFIPSGALIDHIVTSAGLLDEVGDVSAVIPPLDREQPWYEQVVSDHLPVVLSIPLPPAQRAQ
ncbi:MAG: hypothetical protein H6708_14840 [Kofleriaceae bacterium]|nr:hypothetical protein [Kofleriaceae bacterium]